MTGKHHPVVNTHNEWDPLEEIIVGTVDGALCSRWISMNVLMLDEERVIVSKGEDTLIQAFKDWVFRPNPCSFWNFETIGGGFHCATVDVRRRGELKFYF